MKRQSLIEALLRNLAWFRNSGVMDPADGSWGLGERIVVTQDNEALEKTLGAFCASSLYDGYCVLEHRRADCNFEAALLFQEAAEFAGAEWKETAERILHYLYCRSGLLMNGAGGSSLVACLTATGLIISVALDAAYPDYPATLRELARNKWRSLPFFHSATTNKGKSES